MDKTTAKDLKDVSKALIGGGFTILVVNFFILNWPLAGAGAFVLLVGLTAYAVAREFLKGDTPNIDRKEKK